MKITINPDWDSFNIQSDSGKNYTISYVGSGDADPEAGLKNN